MKFLGCWLFIDQSLAEKRFAQAPSVGVTDVIDPASDRGVEFGEGDGPGAILIPSGV